MAKFKRWKRSVPGCRYMSVRMGQLSVADIREIFPGDFFSHRCRIGVHLSPMQAPELAPLLIRQDTFFVPNRILWDYWDNYISQKLLEDTAVGPFSEDQLLLPQVTFCFGAGFHASGGNAHIDNVRGIYDLLEQLGARFSYTDKQNVVGSSSNFYYTGSVFSFNALPLMGYWRIWHDFYRDAFLQNDQFQAYTDSTLNRNPGLGDPWADESPVPDTVTAASSWNAPLSSLLTSIASQPGGGLPGYTVNFAAPNSTAHSFYKGIFSFAKRQPGMTLAVIGPTVSGTAVPPMVLPGTCCAIPLDLGVLNGNDVLQPGTSIGMCAPVCMPKDYIFTARQSPVYNADVATPDSVRDLRKAFQVLGYREKVNRFDNRIKAWLWNMFHVNVSDKRLDSPFWLHGSQSIINTQEVLGTVNNTDTVLGQLGGFGIGAIRGRSCKMRAEDHGFLYTLFYIVPTPVYGDGVRRYWFRGSLYRNRRPVFDGSLDFPLPDFARIGQQTIYNGEISFMGHRGDDVTFARNTAPFGYGDRYSELGFSNCDVCGDFRTTLKFWHTGLFYGDSVNASGTPDSDLPAVRGVSGDFISLYSRKVLNQRMFGDRIENSIASNLSYRLFDSGVTADQFWCVVSTDFYVSSRLPAHPQPGHADHTSKVV